MENNLLGSLLPCIPALDLSGQLIQLLSELSLGCIHMEASEEREGERGAGQ